MRPTMVAVLSCAAAGYGAQNSMVRVAAMRRERIETLVSAMEGGII
jgi:hypothetical protein